ncbi:MAG: hypothetical protein QOH88_1770 [Verrucomicrobiota bacterium]|jgi:hypothetical protein
MHQLSGRLPLTETIVVTAVSVEPDAPSKINFADELDQEIVGTSKSIVTDSGEVDFTNLYLAVADKGPKEVLRHLGQ